MTRRSRQCVRNCNRILSAYPIDPSQPCEGFGDNPLWVITDSRPQRDWPAPKEPARAFSFQFIAINIKKRGYQKAAPFSPATRKSGNALREQKQMFRLFAIRFRLQVLVPEPADRNNHIDDMAPHRYEELPFSGFDALNGLLLRQLPVRPVIVHPAYSADALMGVEAVSFLDATYLMP